MREEFGSNSDTVIPDLYYGLSRLLICSDPNESAGVGVLRRIVEQIDHYLLHPSRVRLNPNWISRNRYRKIVRACIHEWADRLHGVVHNDTQVDLLRGQPQFALRN